MDATALAGTSDPAFDPDCFDFVTYVARRRGLSRPSAAQLVKAWVVACEPSDAARRAIGRSRASERPPASGVFSAVPVVELERTGTTG